MSLKLFKSTSLVAAMTMTSRVVGFLRDVVFAILFGATPVFDAYVVAFKIPNFLRRLFADGAFSQAFVPILSEYRESHTEESMRDFIARVAGTLGATVMMVVVLAEIIAPLVIMIFAPGFLIKDLTRYHDAVHMIRITFPYLFLISITALSGAVLNTFGRFGPPAFAPVLLNVVLLLVAWLWAPHTAEPIYILAWGVLLGGLAQFLIQLPYLKRLGYLIIPVLGWRDPGVQRVMKLMLPALFGVSVAQISLMVDNVFASFLQVGSISWLYYSDRLIFLPLGVVGVAIATVVLPHLSRQHANRSEESYSAIIDWGLRCTLVLGMPAAVGLLVLAGPILATLIYHGAFTSRDVYMTRESLMAFSVGLPGFMLVKVLASAFYSRQNIKTPVKIAVICMIANVAFNLALVFPLKHGGLALATSLSSLLNTGLLMGLLLKRRLYQPQPQWLIFVLRIGLANVAMALLVGWLAGDLGQWLLWSSSMRAWHLTWIIAAGMVSYIFILFLSGMRVSHFQSKRLGSAAD